MLPRKIALLLPFAVLAACVGPDPYYGDETAGGGTGGSVTGNGGSSGDGGSSGNPGTGGAVGSGGTTGGGGGGSTGRGGAGGATSTGGATGRGGSGGSTSTGGSGGATGTGGAGGGGPATTLMLDTFESTGNINVIGWISPDTNGTWSVAADGATNHVWSETATVGSEAKSISGDSSWTDQVIEVRMRPTMGSIGSVKMLVYGRYADDKNYFSIELTQSQLKVRKKSAGSSSDVGRYKIPTNAQWQMLNMWNTVRLEILGGKDASGNSTTTARGYFNGMATDVATDPTPTAPILAGGMGIGVNSGAADFDDVKVTSGP
jgi:hypothetical protein